MGQMIHINCIWPVLVVKFVRNKVENLFKCRRTIATRKKN